MDKKTKQTVMFVVTAFTLIGFIAPLALRQVPTSNNNQPVFPAVINKVLAPEERVQILRAGRTLIEYYYLQNCTDCLDKKNLYESFAGSKDFQGYITAATAEVNETTKQADWLVTAQGITNDLKDVQTSDDLVKKFCQVALQKPNLCLLEEV